MARKLGAATGRRVAPTTVQGWAERGVIPAARQADVLRASAAEGLPLEPVDFFDLSPGEGAAIAGAVRSVPAAAPSPPPGPDAGTALLSVAEMGVADRLAIEGGTAEEKLMEAAGRGTADIVRARFPRGAVAVLCGPGNNGGDGFVIARRLARAGWPVRVGLLGPVAGLKGDAALNARRWAGLRGRGSVEVLSPAVLKDASLVVDALFGAGLSRPLEGPARATIEAVAERGLPTVAVDIPSGVDGDTGEVRGAAAPARVTVTFFRKKPGHLLLPGREFCGEVRVIDIGIPAAVLERIAPATFENGPALWLERFPWARTGDHKYSRGHLIVCGGTAMTGAARLAARAGLRIGAGLVTIASAPEAVPIYAGYMPGVLTTALERRSDLARLLADARRRAVLIGPGYGVGRRTREHVATALALGKRVCLDADALTSFADASDSLFAAAGANREAGGAAVLTPHEGEFARLFPDLGGSKLARARAAAARSGAVVLLKGPDTVIADPGGRAAINANAPPDLATAGSGDVLAGLIAGLLVQGVAAFEAAAIAAWIHGAAGGFGPGLIAEDLPERVPAVLRALRALG